MFIEDMLRCWFLLLWISGYQKGLKKPLYIKDDNFEINKPMGNSAQYCGTEHGYGGLRTIGPLIECA